MEEVKMKRFIDCYIPTETCNLRCHYCYIAQHRKFNNKIVKFDYEPAYIRKALSKERLGGTCMLNLCAGGETLIAEEVIWVIKALLEEGHYLMVVTNGTLTNRFQEIAKFPKELLDRLFFKFSFHYLEFLRLNLLDRFFENVKMMKDAGASFTVEITPSDELIEHIDDIKKVCMEKLGTLCHITIGRKDSGDIPVLTEKTFDEYKEIWKTFDSDLFKFKSEIFYKKRKEFCYAGEWSFYLNLATGDYKQCYCGVKLGNIYENIEKPIKLLAVGNNCTQPHCYNGHAFLSFGCIPELKTPTYDTLRNREVNGEAWLTDSMKKFMQCKLVDSNKEYSQNQKNIINAKNISRKFKNKILKVKNRITK